MTNVPYHDTIKDDILELLSDAPRTSRELEARLQVSYPSLRRAMIELENEGRIVKFDRRARGARYTLGSAVGPKSIVPYVSFNNNSIKLTQLTPNAGLVETGVTTYNDIIKAWTIIAITAKRLSTGVPDQVLVKRLNRQKAELAKARSFLENTTFLINQLLDNPKLWDIESLVQFVDDKDWAEFEPILQQMYSQYFDPKE